MTRFCVPTAISIISGRPYDEIIAYIKNHLGDQSITGVYLGTCAKVLLDLGYDLISINENTATNKLEKYSTYLVHVRGHVGIIYNNKWFDNAYPAGRPIGKIKALGIYKVSK